MTAIPRAILLPAAGLMLLAGLAAAALAQEPVAAKKQWQGTVTARSLNVRAGPGEGHEIVAKLRRGDAVTAVDERDRWVRLIGLAAIVEGDPPAAGWVHKAFVRLPEDFMAPAFGEEGNAFLDWAARRGDLQQIAIDADDRLSIVLAPDAPTDEAGRVARTIGCEYRERLAIEAPVTVTVWPENGPGAGWVAQAVCP